MRPSVKFVLAIASAALLQTPAFADPVLLRTGTRGGVELDFDGPLTETTLELGFTEKVFTLTGAAIPLDPAFANITSITLTFTAFGGELSADNGGINPIGIGISSAGDSTLATRSALSSGRGESLMVSLGFTSSSPLDSVMLTGISIESWRNAFPVSEVTFAGATIGGSAVLIGDTISPVAFPIGFDAQVSSFTIESTGGDDVRLAGVTLTAVVPEPSSALLLIAGIALAARRRRT